MDAPELVMSLLDAKFSAKAFIKQRVKPPPIKFEHVGRDCCKYGVTNMDEPAREELARALATNRDFDTDYFTDRKEPYAWRIYRDDGVLGLEATVSMSEPDDLIDTAVWEAYGKDKYAGSGYEAAMRKWKFTEEQAENWMRALVQAINIQSEANEYHEFAAGNPDQHDLDTVLNTLNELDSLCSGKLEDEYNRLVDFVKSEGRHYAAVIKAGHYVPDPGMPDEDDLAQAEADVDESKGHQLVKVLLEEVYRLSNTQLKLPSPLDDFVVKWGRMNVPDDALYYSEDGGMGRETEAHITVLYGLTEAEPSEALLDVVRRTKPFTVRLGPLSIFRNDEYDVLKFSVVSEDLVALSDAIRAACPNENKFPKYIPHCTVAYCKKGTVDHMEGVYPFAADPPIPNEFEAWELWFKGAGDSEDSNRVVRSLEFGGKYREEANAKSFINSLERWVVIRRRVSEPEYAADHPSYPGELRWVRERRKAKVFSSQEDATSWLRKNYGNQWMSHWDNFLVYRDIYPIREGRVPGNLDDALSTSIGQALPFRNVPVGATFIHDGNIIARRDSEARGWRWFGGGYVAIGENEVVRPVTAQFSPFDKLPFPEEISVLRGKLRRR